MFFKKDKQPPQEGAVVPSTPIVNNADASTNSEKSGTIGQSKDKPQIVYPTGIKLALLMTSIFTGMFLVALDKLIISTAVPKITDEFHSANDIGWYGTAYLLTNCVSLLLFGKLYSLLNIKATFLAAVLVFEVGSVICGAAPTSIAFIIGRAIAGFGAGGVQGGCITIIVFAVPLAKRPKYQGFFGAVFGVASVLSPTVGGAFTTNVSWRWCFYINLPFGAIVAAFAFLLLSIPNRDIPGTWKHKIKQLNIVGLLALVPGVVCLCLALQWGGFTYSWSSWRIILLLVVGILLLITFALIQVWKPEQATVPPKIFMQRSIASGFLVSCCTGAHQTLLIYFLPIWFQAAKGVSAVKSGIDILPMVLPIVLASILSGHLTSYIGYYTPFLIAGICLSAIGTGLLTTLQLNTTTGQWVGYQILYGFGFGLYAQAPNMAAQAVLPRKEVSIGASLMFFAQTLFGAVFVSIGQNVLDNKLIKNLSGVVNLTAAQIENAGVTGLFEIIPVESRLAALVAYNNALRVVFQVALAMATIAILGGATMEWINVKTKKDKLSADEPKSERPIEGEQSITEDESRAVSREKEADGVTDVTGTINPAVQTVSQEANSEKKF